MTSSDQSLPFIDEEVAKGRFNVHRSAYTADLVELEYERVFDRCWLYLGHENEVPASGDFKLRNLGRRSVIFIRSGDGKVRGLLNACSHRGAEVCRKHEGNASNFVCPYHGWNFANDGSLVAATKPEAYGGDFDEKAHGLSEVPRLEAYRGLMFVSFNPEVEALESYLAGAKEILDLILDQAEGEMEIVHGTHEYGIHANWKLLVENSIENYHAVFTHARWLGYLNRQKASIPGARRSDGGGRDLGNGHGMMENRVIFGRPIAQWVPAFGDAVKPKIERLFERLCSLHGEERATRIGKHSKNLLIFPNLIVNDVQGVVLRTFYPVSAGEMRVTSWALAPKDEDPEIRTVRLDNYLSFLGPGGFATPDDVELLESCQRGFANTEAEWSDMSRDLRAEQPSSSGETQIRAFWRRWSQLLDKPRPKKRSSIRLVPQEACND
jgi:phenylpropionate dioxygenase-like ring-hydroxylating dioxygenase large terminal subunit